MKPVVLHPHAETELEQAADRYEQEREVLGGEFRLEFEAALARLLDNPQLYAIERNDLRRCPLHRFPYTIYYADMADRVWIAAVAHQHRRPGYWTRRKRQE